jgi:hypothetical protein
MFQNVVPFHFQCGKNAKSQGTKSGEQGGWGMMTKLLLGTNCLVSGTFGRAHCRDEEPVVIAPKYQSFLLHIFSQAAQNVTEKNRVDRSVRRNKFRVNTTLHDEKKPVCSLMNSGPAATFFCSWRWWALPLQQMLLCFWIITVNPTFPTHYKLRDKIWALINFPL